VLRRHAYEVTHPDVEIIYLSPYWQAIVREDVWPDDHYPALVGQAAGQARTAGPGTVDYG